MWCWGCDVRRAEGNLLAAYGAHKQPSPDPRYHSAYVFHLDTGAALSLWGWGLWTADPDHGSLLIGRARFRLRYTQSAHPMPAAWRERDLPPTRSPSDADSAQVLGLLVPVLRWISDYEAWLNEQTEPGYRARTVAGWPQRRQHQGGVAAAAMTAHWEDLADAVEGLRVSLETVA